ncbi:hypothetical protein ASD85_10825 [Rhizobium sp. Root651]|nr:hypothetical protein ASD85_10825 [Rhizobium sp. Root651]
MYCFYEYCEPRREFVNSIYSGRAVHGASLAEIPRCLTRLENNLDAKLLQLLQLRGDILDCPRG